MSFSLTAKLLLQSDQRGIINLEKQLQLLSRDRTIKLHFDSSSLQSVNTQLKSVNSSVTTMTKSFASAGLQIYALNKALQAMSIGVDAFSQQEQSALKLGQILAITLKDAKQFQQQIRNVGQAVGGDTLKLSELTADLGAAGLSTNFLKKNIEVLGKTLLSSQVAGSVKELEKMIISLNKVFNVGAEDLREYLEIGINLSRRYPIKFGEIAQSVGGASGALKNIGLTGKQSMALATVGGAHSGLSGSMLMTGLRSAAMTLGDVRKQKQLKSEFGLDVSKLRGMDLVNAVFGKAAQIKQTKGEGSQEFLSFMKILSERRNSSIIRSVVDNLGELNRELEIMGETSKSLTEIDREATLAQETFLNKSQKVANALINMATKLGDSISNSLSVSNIESVVRALNTLGDQLATLLLIAGGVGAMKLGKKTGMFAPLVQQTDIRDQMGAIIGTSGQSRTSQVMGRIGRAMPSVAMVGGMLASGSDNEYISSAGSGLMVGGAAAMMGVNPFISAILGATVAVDGFAKALNKAIGEKNVQDVKDTVTTATNEFRNKGVKSVDFHDTAESILQSFNDAGYGRRNWMRVWQAGKNMFSSGDATLRGADDTFFNQDMERVKILVQEMETPIQQLVDDFVKTGKNVKDFESFMGNAGKEAGLIYDLMDDMKLNQSQKLMDLVKKRKKETGQTTETGQDISTRLPSLERWINQAVANNISIGNISTKAFGMQDTFSGGAFGTNKWRSMIGGTTGGKETLTVFDQVQKNLATGQFSRDNYKTQVLSGLDAESTRMVQNIVDKMSFEEFEKGLQDIASLTKQLTMPFEKLWANAEQTAQALDKLNAVAGEKASAYYDSNRKIASYMEAGNTIADTTAQVMGFPRFRVDSFRAMQEQVEAKTGTSDTNAMKTELSNLNTVMREMGGLTATQVERQRILVESLSDVANVSKNLASTFEELQEVQKRLTQGDDTAKEFFLGGAKEKMQIMRELQLAESVQNPMGLSEKDRKAWWRGIERQSEFLRQDGRTVGETRTDWLRQQFPQFYGDNIQRRDQLRQRGQAIGQEAFGANAFLQGEEQKTNNALREDFMRFQQGVDKFGEWVNRFQAAVNTKQQIEITGGITHNGIVLEKAEQTTRNMVNKTANSQVSAIIRNRDIPVQNLMGLG